MKTFNSSPIGEPSANLAQEWQGMAVLVPCALVAAAFVLGVAVPGFSEGDVEKGVAGLAAAALFGALGAGGGAAVAHR